MRKVTVLCVGRLKEPFYEAAAAEYVKRLGRFCKLEIVELAEQRLPENPSPAEVARGLAKEAEAIRAKLPPAATVVALCVEGRMKSSEELAQLLEGSEQLACIIGGSFGLDPSIKAAAQLRLSMSPMTFPHHLARVMLLEQIYRGFQINGGGKYHK
ncbi:MAG: 23S rRNA (pseudouridine(1915)-N(3))-methyltransferase RlmH [Oscillospiraceae bacterium]|jgi:23S rRNA (pseudouridine1915-N3)-methyltransferase|nr:23S rRNA (pseudouridine(1915)-N(3))-methyltransferase RlmH [Oscillospiraceae bacterium]